MIFRKRFDSTDVKQHDILENGAAFSGIQVPSEFNQENSGASSESSLASSHSSSSSSLVSSAASVKIVQFRGHNVAAFDIDGKEMICLPQVCELV
uniref:Ski_Sno domain-containing protein n=1 Tax=Caenorhabditis japonica TaxID=281687 RepID=A0A8R1IKI3_CAEJA